ncbi:MAG: hypothetical protein ACRDTQ_08635, partial [Micromonosporaceae bacterium]
LVNRRMYGAIMLAADRQADLNNGGLAPGVASVWGSIDLGFWFASFGVFCLALTVCRFAWPARDVRGYAGFATAMIVLAAGVPWSYQYGVSAKHVVIREYWVTSFGAAGLWFTVSVGIGIAMLLLAGVREHRAWWPSAVTLAALIAGVVCLAMVKKASAPPHHIPVGYEVGDVVDNTGMSLLWLLAGAILTVCALVSATRTPRATVPAEPTVPEQLSPTPAEPTH